MKFFAEIEMLTVISFYQSYKINNSCSDYRKSNRPFDNFQLTRTIGNVKIVYNYKYGGTENERYTFTL